MNLREDWEPFLDGAQTVTTYLLREPVRQAVEDALREEGVSEAVEKALREQGVTPGGAGELVEQERSGGGAWSKLFAAGVILAVTGTVYYLRRSDGLGLGRSTDTGGGRTHGHDGDASGPGGRAETTMGSTDHDGGIDNETGESGGSSSRGQMGRTGSHSTTGPGEP